MKKYIILITLNLLMIVSAIGQISIGKSMGQIITENAIEGSVVIIKQSYQVKDKKSGKIYGRFGRNDFGQVFSIGVKSNVGLVVSEPALKPWLYDDAYMKVEENYEPIISLTEIRNIEKDLEVKFKQNPLQIKQQQPDGLWIASADYDGMALDDEEGSKDGWLIWYSAQNELSLNPESEVSIQTINKQIEVKSSGNDIEIDAPVNSEKIIGGIYVRPVFRGGGHVDYILVGMAVTDGTKWKLRTPFVGYVYDKDKADSEEKEQQEQAANADANADIKSEEDIKLTPIGSPDKNGKKRSKKSKK